MIEKIYGVKMNSWRRERTENLRLDQRSSIFEVQNRDSWKIAGKKNRGREKVWRD